MWGEHLYFELKNLDPEEATGTMITLRLLNKGWVKNEVIGIFEFSMSSIYFSEGHKIEHAWAALSNTDTEDFSEIKGLIKMSICVTGPKDNAIKLDEDTGPEPPEMKMMMTSSTKRTFKQLSIKIIEGRGFPNKKDDVYCTCQYQGGNPLRTEMTPQIEEKANLMTEFLIPV